MVKTESFQGFGAIVRVAAAAALIIAVPVRAQQVPQFEVDPLWPQLPLGNNWLTGGLGGMCLDSRDHVYILNRQNVVADDLDGAILAPPVIELDPEGNVVRGWGDPDLLGGRLHDCHVDSDQNVWIVAAATGVVQKYSNDGSELLLLIGERGSYDSADGTRGGRPLNSDRARFFLPGSIDIDAASGDIYVADGELPGGNYRIAVLDRNGRFLRQWSLHRSEDEGDITPLPHCLRLSNDGLVYVCDRTANRIQVFDQDGTYRKEIFIEPRTRGAGSTWEIAFSRDAAQRFMYVADGQNRKIHVLDREALEVLYTFGDGGRQPGQFYGVHSIETDSEGNIYTTETWEGKRLQKFVYQGMGTVEKGSDLAELWPTQD